jgi:small basic protein (TIGR04137 family)
MSIHSSLRSAGKGRKHRSVLKRHERLKVLKDKGLWSDEKSVLGIPKVKMQKLKVRKEKAVAEAGGTGAVAGKPAEGAAAPAAPTKGGAAPGGKSDKK